MLDSARVLIVTLWVGSLWTIGYFVAPMLFATLSDKAVAGTLAGNMFRIEAWVTVACALLLLLLAAVAPHQQGGKLWIGLIVGMLVCTLIGYFALQPYMAALREAAGAGGVMASAARGKFGMLHGISSGFYLLQSVLGIMLVLKAR